MLQPHISARACFLFKALELVHGCEKAPALASAKLEVAPASGLLRFKADECLDDVGGLIFFHVGLDMPGAGLGGVQRGRQHGADLLPRLRCVQIPSEGQQVPPEALLLLKQLHR
ncbi:hypothetical protein GOP47_0030974, partial [Adiantum capillus-veneris]